MQTSLPPPYYGSHFSDPSLQNFFIIPPPQSSPLISPTSDSSLEARKENKTQNVAQKWFAFGRRGSKLDWNWRGEQQLGTRKEWAAPNSQNSN